SNELQDATRPPVRYAESRRLAFPSTAPGQHAHRGAGVLMATARVIVLIGGACLLGALVASVGVEPVADAFATMSWWLLVVLVFPCVPGNIFDTLGWRFAFPHDRVSFLTLWRARLAGEAVNTVTPTASVGGEAVKAWLVRPRAP